MLLRLYRHLLQHLRHHIPRATLVKFVRYALVGLSSTLLDFGLLAALTDGAGWKPLAANPVCFALGVTNSFVWNRRWTFPEAGDREPLGQYARFVLVNLIGVSINQGVLAAALFFGPQAGLDAAWCKWGGKVVALPVGGLWNFAANARWTFKPSRPPDHAVR
jgi:putative flippase GtrA